MGADMVFIGRPVIWGLSYAGEEGVRQVLTLLRDELSLAMKLCGVCSVQVRSALPYNTYFQRFTCCHFQDISSAIVRHESYFRNRSKL